MRISKMAAIVIAVALIFALISLSLFIYVLKTKPNQNVESVTLGRLSVADTASIFVAEYNGYFAENGLNVTSLNYPNGVQSLTDLVDGKLDFALATEYPVVGRALNSSAIRIVSTIAKSTNSYIFARNDSGITSPTDLAGKKIAVTYGAIDDFYLHRYLVLNGINLQSITIVDYRLYNETALVDGSIDAMVGTGFFRYPFPNNVIAALNINLGQPGFFSVICRADFTETHSQTITNFLRALDQAETFIANNPSEAKTITQQKLNITIQENVWRNTQFLLSLDQPLVTAMRDEAQFMINNHLTNQTQAPNFVHYIYTDALKSIRPDVVSISG